MAQAVIGLF